MQVVDKREILERLIRWCATVAGGWPKVRTTKGVLSLFCMDPQKRSVGRPDFSLSACFIVSPPRRQHGTTTAFASLSSATSPRQRRLGDCRSMREISEIGVAIYVFAKRKRENREKETKSFLLFGGDTTRRASSA
jgi:hypothetical protein